MTVAPGLSAQEKVLTLVGVLMALFLAALDQTVVATAGPKIQEGLGIAPSLYTWLTTSYLVASTVLVPVYGKLSDLYGRKRIVIFGVGLFLVASALCGFSQSTSQLIAFRALQGAGSASIFTSAFAVVADLFSPAERGKYTGIVGSVFAVSSLVGPLLGGFITDTLGWHWVFFINLPLGLVALAFIWLRMPAFRSPGGTRLPVDGIGAALLALSIVPLLVALSLGRAQAIAANAGEVGFGWTSWQALSLFSLSAVAAVGFFFWERRVAGPLIDLTLFRNPIVSWGSATVFVMGGVFLTPMVFLPLFMVNVVGVSATASGLTISPLVLGVVAGNVLSGQLVARLGRYKALMVASLLLLGVGLCVMALTLTPSSSQGEVTIKMVLLGLGLGPSIPLYTIAIQNAVAPDQMGQATSMVTFFRQMGSTVGLAIVGSLFGTTLTHELSARTHAATQGLPPGLIERFAAGATSKEALGDHSGARRFDVAQAKAQAMSQIEAARMLARKAVGGDRLAAALVAQNSLADERLRVVARAGGAKAMVRSGFESLLSRIEVASQTPEAWASLQQSADLSVEARRELSQIPAQVVSDPVARANALARIRQALEANQSMVEERAHQQALVAVETSIDAEVPKVMAAIEAMGSALSEAFTEAIRRVFALGLGFAAAALLLTLKLPQKPLRTSSQTPSRAA